MPAPTGNAVHASLVFLGLVDFARKGVMAQAALRERLDAAVTRSIAPLEPADRIVANAPDGLAIAVLASPSEALLVARRVRRLARGEGGEPFALRIGVDHGAIRLSHDEHGEPCLAGDGVATGVAVAGFSGPGRLLVSRAFRDALTPGDPERSARLQPVGTQTDANLRKHELYAFEGPAGDGEAATVAGAAPSRRPLVLAALAIAGLLGAGFAVRAARKSAEGAKRPAVVSLAIEPGGEIVVDGVSRGRTPPLTRIEIPPGKRTIEIRHPPQQPLVLRLDLDPGEELALRHSFAAPAAVAPVQRAPRPPAQAQKEQPSRVRRMWNDFRKEAGF
jgi:hypothetical protein